ncbi:hypothetical protein FAIPA1_310043 [Frankia sp. AiPs1]
MTSPICSAGPSIWSPSAGSTRCYGRPSWLKHGPCMRRDAILLGKMIEAADQAQRLTDGITTGGLEADRQRQGTATPVCRRPAPGSRLCR